jgi:ankyrin repeat protein
MKKDIQVIEDIMDAICNNDLFFMKNHFSEYSIDQRLKDSDNDTLVMYSLSDINSDIYKFLIDQGANLELTNDLGETVIHSAVYSGDIIRLRDIISLTNTLVNKESNDGTSPLLLATALGDYEMVKELVSIGANLNQCDMNNVYPIHIACQEGALDLVKLFIDNNAELRVISNAGNVPISLAANHCHDEIVRILYSKIYV